MNNSTAAPRPSLLRRLAAITYDTFLVLPLIMLAVALATGLLVLVGGDGGYGSGNYDVGNLGDGGYGDGNLGAVLPPWLVRIIAALTVVAFYCHFWRRGGQSLGMRAWRLRLRSADGGGITLRQGILRCLGAALSAAPLGLGYWWCLLGPGHRCWHDHLSGTELELLPKREH